MKKPFFTNFLEEQDVKEVTGGKFSKLPFNEVTNLGQDQLEVTMKAPSDGDEGAELELF
jgi:hypothetical protein